MLFVTGIVEQRDIKQNFSCMDTELQLAFRQCNNYDNEIETKTLDVSQKTKEDCFTLKVPIVFSYSTILDSMINSSRFHEFLM